MLPKSIFIMCLLDLDVLSEIVGADIGGKNRALIIGGDAGC